MYKALIGLLLTFTSIPLVQAMHNPEGDDSDQEQLSLFEQRVAVAIAQERTKMDQRVADADRQFAAEFRAHKRTRNQQGWCFLY